MLERLLQAWQNLALQRLAELLLHELLNFLWLRHRLRGAWLLQDVLLLDYLLEDGLHLHLNPRQDDLSDLVVDVLDLLGQERDDEVADVLANNALAHTLLDRLLNRRFDLLLLLLLAGEELLELIGLLRQLLVLSRQLSQVLDHLLLLDFLQLLFASLVRDGLVCRLRYGRLRALLFLVQGFWRRLLLRRLRSRLGLTVGVICLILNSLLLLQVLRLLLQFLLCFPFFL